MLELLVAVVILSIGLMGMASLMIGSIHSNKTSSDMSIATTLAQEKMEKIRQAAYFGVGAAGTNVTESYNSITNYPSFQREVTVSSLSGESGIKVVTVKVSWEYLYNHSVELKTILSR